MVVSRFSTRHPVTVLMAVLAVLVLGVLAYGQLRVDLMPNIASNHIVVQTSMDNTSPEEIENLITRPIEETVTRVNNVAKISSSSFQGKSMVDIEFKWGTDIDIAVSDVRSRIDRISDTLPAAAKTPVVWKIDISNKAVATLALTGKQDLRELRRIAEEVVSDRLEQITGVASVDIYGGHERQILISIDQGRLQSYGLSLKQVSERLAQENVDFSGGYATEGKSEYLVRTLGQFKSIEDMRQVVLASPGGASVRIMDVATVQDSHKEARVLSHYNGKPAVSLAVRKQPDANTMEVVDGIKAAMDKIQKEIPGAELVITYDQGGYIKNSVMNVQENAVIGGLLAIGVVFLFLRSLRSTFIVSLSIPLSLIATFMMFKAKDISINLMSLGGLALGVGMIVDDAIVVLENIYRHLGQGKTVWQATDDATEEIGAAVISTTITVMVVFLPIAFAQGISGQLFAEFALAVVFSIGVSLLMALTVVPCLATQLLKPSDGHASQTFRFAWLNKMLDAWEKIFVKLEQEYRTILVYSLGNRRRILAIALAMFLGSLTLLPLIGSELMPATDSGNFTIFVTTPVGTAFEKTDQNVAKVEEILKTVPEIDNEITIVGTVQKFGMRPAPNTAYISVTLKNKRDRSTQQVVADLRARLRSLPGTGIRFSMTDLVVQLLTANKSPVELKIFGPDMDTLSQLADKASKLMKQVPGIRDVNLEVDDSSLELQVKVDRTKASQYGMTTTAIAGQIRTAVGGSTATRYNLSTAKNEIDIVVQLSESQRKAPADIADANITLPSGQTILLKDVATVQKSTGPNQLTRENRNRMLLLSANALDRDKGSISADLRETMKGLTLPPGYSIKLGGDDEDMQSSFSTLTISLLLAIALVYMVLASQFESLAHPFAILLSLPLSIVGVLISLLLTGKAFGMTVFIGVIMLVGIVVKNAILLVDYINTLRTQGMEREQALLTAGPVRLRPILMTTIAMILGMIPIALGIGTSSETNTPMAIAVIGGLLTSTLLTLVVVPVAYTYVDNWETKAAWIKRPPAE
ncbi:MAG: efflux RND transporter permease subunit [Negativicutes bacterium]